MKSKRCVAILLGLALACMLSACGNKAASNTQTGADKADVEQWLEMIR